MPRSASNRQHRAQRPAAEDVNMQMRHFLMAVLPDVGEQAISGLNQPHFARNMTHGPDKSGYFGVGGSGAGRRQLPGRPADG